MDKELDKRFIYRKSDKECGTGDGGSGGTGEITIQDINNAINLHDKNISSHKYILELIENLTIGAIIWE